MANDQKNLLVIGVPPGSGRRFFLLEAINLRRNYERYLALVREAATEGDSVQTEHWYQHAEHYFRMMKERMA